MAIMRLIKQTAYQHIKTDKILYLKGVLSILSKIREKKTQPNQKYKTSKTQHFYVNLLINKHNLHNDTLILSKKKYSNHDKRTIYLMPIHRRKDRSESNMN